MEEYKYTSNGDEHTLESAQKLANSTGTAVHLYRTPGDNGADYVSIEPEAGEEKL